MKRIFVVLFLFSLAGYLVLSNLEYKVLGIERHPEDLIGETRDEATLEEDLTTSVDKIAKDIPSNESSKEEFLMQRRARLHFKVPDIRPSRNLEGGAPAGGCYHGLRDNKPIQIKALQPSTKIGLTTEAKPTIFVQISSTSVEEAIFTLLNAKGDTIIYEKTFPLTKTGGVIRFTLPADAEALEVGKEYLWELAVYCDPEDMRGNPHIEGSIKRIQPSQKLLRDLASAGRRERVKLYAEAGYWYDCLKAIADLRSANPNDSMLITDWNDLLESVGLSQVAKEPLL